MQIFTALWSTEILTDLCTEKQPVKQLSKKELKKKEQEEMDAIFAELGVETKAVEEKQEEKKEAPVVVDEKKRAANQKKKNKKKAKAEEKKEEPQAELTEE